MSARGRRFDASILHAFLRIGNQDRRSTPQDKWTEHDHPN